MCVLRCSESLARIVEPVNLPLSLSLVSETRHCCNRYPLYFLSMLLLSLSSRSSLPSLRGGAVEISRCRSSRLSTLVMEAQLRSLAVVALVRSRRGDAFEVSRCRLALPTDSSLCWSAPYTVSLLRKAFRRSTIPPPSSDLGSIPGDSVDNKNT